MIKTLNTSDLYSIIHAYLILLLLTQTFYLMLEKSEDAFGPTCHVKHWSFTPTMSEFDLLGPIPDLYQGLIDPYWLFHRDSQLPAHLSNCVKADRTLTSHAVTSRTQHNTLVWTGFEQYQTRWWHIKNPSPAFQMFQIHADKSCCPYCAVLRCDKGKYVYCATLWT